MPYGHAHTSSKPQRERQKEKHQTIPATHCNVCLWLRRFCYCAFVKMQFRLVWWLYFGDLFSRLSRPLLHTKYYSWQRRHRIIINTECRHHFLTLVGDATLVSQMKWIDGKAMARAKSSPFYNFNDEWAGSSENFSNSDVLHSRWPSTMEH